MSSICDRIVTQDELQLLLIRALNETDPNQYETLTLGIYLICERVSDNLRPLLDKCIRRSLLFTASRLVRKCAAATLRRITDNNNIEWIDYLIIIDALEEPQVIHDTLIIQNTCIGTFDSSSIVKT
jgi:hypothetical protein